MLFQKSTGFRVILHAGHDHQGNKGLRLPCDAEQIFNETLENIQVSGLSHVKHAFRVIKSQPGALAAGQKHSAYLAVTDGLNADFTVFCFFVLHFFLCQRAQRRKFSPFLHKGVAVLKLGAFQPQGADLLQQMLLLGYSQSVIKPEQMLLAVCGQILLCFCISHKIYVGVSAPVDFHDAGISVPFFQKMTISVGLSVLSKGTKNCCSLLCSANCAI